MRKTSEGEGRKRKVVQQRRRRTELVQGPDTFVITSGSIGIPFPSLFPSLTFLQVLPVQFKK
jgi:hypothetical protein